MPVPIIDASKFPLVLVVYPQGTTADDLQPFFAELEGIYRRGRLAIVADVGRLTDAKPSDRQAVAEGIDRITGKYPGRVVAEAIVTPSTVLRCMVTAYSWLKKDRSYPSQCFADRISAVAWVRKRLAEEGIVSAEGESGPVTPHS